MLWKPMIFYCFFFARPPLARQSRRSNRHLTSHFQSMVMRPNFATEKLCFFLQAPHSFILSNDFTKWWLSSAGVGTSLHRTFCLCRPERGLLPYLPSSSSFATATALSISACFLIEFGPFRRWSGSEWSSLYRLSEQIGSLKLVNVWFCSADW